MNTTNVMESMDIDEKAACNVKNTDSVDNLEQKMKNTDRRNSSSNVKCIEIVQNLATCLENLAIEENCGHKTENTGIEERPTSSVEIIDEENPASNVGNIEGEENSLDSEMKNAYDLESIIALLKRGLSDFKNAIENLFNEKCDVRKSFVASDSSQDFLLSQKDQNLMALIKKLDSCLSAIKHELKYWDDINDLTNEELITAIENRRENGENPFTRIIKEGVKLVNILRLLKEF